MGRKSKAIERFSQNAASLSFQWMTFKSQKDKLMSTFERMDKYQKYLYEQSGETNEEALTTKLLTACDIDLDRLNRAQTLEEVLDLREQFYVYYNEDIPGMRIREKVMEYHEEHRAGNHPEDDEELDLSLIHI